MKIITYIICSVALLLLSSFRSNLECDYASSNVGFARSQIREALGTDNINKARFYSYKALNAFEKLKVQFKECDCTIAEKNRDESLELLILATKSNSLAGTKNYLSRCLELTKNTMLALQGHDTHDSDNADNEWAMNSNGSSLINAKKKNSQPLSLIQKIDSSLVKYKHSLTKVVETVNCEEAKAFAKRIYEECENQLLQPDLTEGKKYYNLRTKEITHEALTQIGTCSKKTP